jgi:hypothetical protein
MSLNVVEIVVFVEVGIIIPLVTKKSVLNVAGNFFPVDTASMPVANLLLKD